MQFMGVEVQVGDIVAFTTPAVPLPEVQAVVIDVVGGVLDVFSTHLIPFRHDGFFPPDHVLSIVVITKAEDAIPAESRSMRFQKEELVEVTLDGEVVQANVIAAYDGLVVARMRDGRHVSSGARSFKRVNDVIDP